MAITATVLFCFTILVMCGCAEVGQEIVDVPIWVAKSRSKRNYLVFPSSSALQLTVGISAALDLTGGPSGQISFCFQHNAELPSNSTELLYPQTIRAKRSVHLYHHLLTFFGRYQENGTECLRKAICQVAATPFKGGLLEDIISFILTPSIHDPWQNTELDMESLLFAELVGKTSGECQSMFPYCETIPLDFMS